MANRRCFRRFSTRIDVRLTLLEEPGLSINASIRDISEGGLQLQIDHCLRVGAALRMDADEVTLYGEVRFCLPRLDGFIVGVSGDGIQIHGNELTCSVQDLLAYWASISSERSARAS